jgi:hypothetical protein
MCRSIKPLFNLEPAATPDEIEAAARQFVRKVSGFRRPSRANQEAVDQAVTEIAGVLTTLLDSMTAARPPKTRPGSGPAGD